MERKPLDKPKRIEDPAAMERCGARGYCEYCGRRGEALHRHHVSTVGARGNDSDENLILLCAEHHSDFHDGRIPRWELEEIVARRQAAAKAALDFAAITCPACHDHVAISERGGRIYCSACGYLFPS